MPRRRKVPIMGTQAETGSISASGKTGSVNRCTHGRLVEDILTEDGQRSGKVRCLECGAQVDHMDRTT